MDEIAKTIVELATKLKNNGPDYCDTLDALVRTRFEVTKEGDDKDFGFFVGLSDEIGHIPQSNVRSLCSPEWLKRCDEELEKIKARNSVRISDACDKLIERFGNEQVLLYAMVTNFNWSKTTLLVWGDYHFDKLAKLFHDLADQKISSVLLEDISWMRGNADCAVIFIFSDKKSSRFNFKGSEHDQSVVLELTQDDLITFAEQVQVFADPSSGAGHQYLDVLGEQPFQFVVSKGEKND